jgi:putative oxidoreductase
MEILLWVGKILFGGYFVMSGLMHFMKMKDMKAYTASKGIPMPGLATAVAGLMLLLGGLYIVFDFYFMIGGWLIISFLVPSAFLMHNFWKAEGAAKMGEMVNFQKNLALAGAMLMIMFM